MSQALENVNVTGADTGPGRVDHPYPPQSAPTQEPRGVSNFVDGSGPIFSMYLEMATEEDKKMVEGWKADADGILIFTGLFSASVASLISVSIQDIRPNPQDTSNFYLANIYQTLADRNRSDISGSLPTPPPFSPPNYAVWVNALLFLSLVISITCALLATLLQQWARRYLKVTQPRYSPHKRARIRTFFFEGIEKFLVTWAVEALPTLLHVSLFLFFAGISVFLWNVNFTIFKLVLSWIGICTALYGCITFVPIFCHDSPYHTPLSLPARHIVTGISYAIFRAVRRLTLLHYFSAESYYHFQSLEERYRKWLIQGMQRTAEETALDLPSEIDARALMWTFDSLDEDHELERFFSGLPGFRSSKFVKDPLPHLTEEQKKKLWVGLMGLLDVTFSSNLLPEHVKDRRAIICAKAFDPAHIPASRVFDKIWSRCQYSAPMTAEIVQIMREWGNNTNLAAAVCMTVANAQRRDDSWFILASHELGIQEPVLREYAAHGDSLSLAILIHVARQQFNHIREGPWPEEEFLEILGAASRFNVQDTSHNLQHGFCALWNQIVLKIQNDNSRWMTRLTLGPIRNIYNALHRETDSAPIFETLWNPFSFPLCNVPGHRPYSTPHVHNGSTSTSFSRVASLVPASIASPEVPFLSVPTPPHADESIMDVPPLDNPQTAHETATESLSIPVTSPDPATSDALVTSGIIIISPRISATSTSASPLSSTSTSTALALQHNVDPLAPSDPPNFRSSASSDPVSDNSLPKESHCSLMVTTHPLSTSALDLGASTEDNGSLKPGSRKSLDLPLANHTIHAKTTALDRLPQSSSLPLAVHSDAAFAGPSLQEYNVERTGDHLSHPSHCSYDDIV